MKRVGLELRRERERELGVKREVCLLDKKIERERRERKGEENGWE